MQFVDDKLTNTEVVYPPNDEIKSRIAAGNRCVYSVRQLFRSSAMGLAVKIKIYKKMVQPAVVFGSETWAVAEMDKK